MTLSNSRSGVESPQNEQVRKVLLWRESLARLPDTHFFELIRMYLGEVKTPYNKQKLIESLGAFLHRPENKRTIAALLSAGDMQIVSAVFFIPAASQEKLSDFFTGTFSFAELYERLMNLEERLLLFRYADAQTGRTVFGTNPLLDDILRPLADIRYLLPPTGPYEHRVRDEPQLSAQLLAALLSFAASDADMCKLDGSFKKRTVQRLADVFPWVKDERSVPFFQTVIAALKNLSILRQNGKGLQPDFRRAASFAAQSEAAQYAYLAAAAGGHCSRSELQKRAQYVLDILAAVPADGFTRKILERSEFLVKHRNKGAAAEGAGKSRFARMLERSASAAENDGPAHGPEDVSVPDGGLPAVSLTESAIRLGLLRYAGTLPAGKSDGEVVYVPALPCGATAFCETVAAASSDAGTGLSAATDTESATSTEAATSTDTARSDLSARGALTRNVLTIDAGFSVTMMPGLPLSRMIPLIRCMDIVRFDTVSVFEITKQSCLRAFDDGLSPEDIVAAFSPFLPYQLPQNLVVSMEDWARSYNAAALYKGYILHVTDGSRLIENNPAIAPYIRKTLAPGLFLLDFADDAEASDVIARSGLDSIGSVKTAAQTAVPVPFLPLGKGRSDFSKSPSASAGGGAVCGGCDTSGVTAASGGAALGYGGLRAETERSDFFNSMRAELDALNLPREQADGLKSRIERKIILNAQQLRGDSVRSEKIEAGGMDFLGKIHVAEHAISTGNMLELVFEDATGGSRSVIVGMPIAIEKKQGDALLCIKVEPGQNVETRSIGQASFVRRLRGAIFREI
ncbi:helicase-associated domain-containing protein [Treponema brennaborense]|uniref:Helicase XPB/Ssl2 N-terminal domain-containing protein n=1 Tax=Treponema brennaborense (strain DSM 12168 / CIP 105900 / DD5/3) TaxID=906968 RepID=F4LN26_TREBD|nr:helicase-associated domain-containing protein [Treponema brennaborense]AEE15812.1 hypothetical protein Trebr_0365 [Treponema brennaborense DSM 12168]